MQYKIVVGAGDFLDIAFQAWRAKLPDVEVVRLEVAQDASHYFDFGFLDRYSPAQTSMFAAFDNRFLNFKRIELMGAIKARGFRMDGLIGIGAVVGAGAMIGENCFVSDGAVIGAAASLQYNVYIGPRAVVGYAAQIAHSVWIESGVILGRRAQVGANTTLGLGVSVADGISIGRLCQIEVPGIYRENIPAKTFFKPAFDGPVRILN